MDQLEIARTNISRIDKQIAQLFAERMENVKEVAAYKKEHSMRIFDPEREAELLKTNISYVQDPEIAAYYAMLQKDIMRYSREYQSRLLDGKKDAHDSV